MICINCDEEVNPNARIWAPSGFCKPGCYIEYMTKNSLWGSEEYAKMKGGWDKRLFKGGG